MMQVGCLRSGTRLRAVVMGAVLAGACAHAAQTGRVILAVTNPTGLQWPEHVLEVPLATLEAKLGTKTSDHIEAQDAETHAALPTQLDAVTPGVSPDRLLVLVDVAPHATVRIAFLLVERAREFKPLVFGRVVPERKDDFAWENDKVAFRVYGPALEATGEITSGIDVWSKRVAELVIDTWYSRDAEGQRNRNPALSYHKDAGQGLDSYDVGPTRGCGGTAVIFKDQLFPSKNYVSAEVLASGPIRLRFRLRYAPWRAGDRYVSEEKIVTLHAGSHLNRIATTLTVTSGETAPPIKLGIGLAMHPGAQLRSAEGGGIAWVWEPLTDPSAGMEGTALVLDPDRSGQVTQADHNALLIESASSGRPVAYYAGAAWSKAGFAAEDAWGAYLRDFRNRLRHPLKTRWE